MDLDLTHPLPIAIEVATAMILLGLFICLVRLRRGPTTADRVVALDLATYLAVGFAALRALATREVQLLGPALVVALLAFLGTIAFARYIERRALR
ncbi:MAG: monovalent cation/H+ antiporter complex subunit F [Myxococcota bacterium]|nr:monovalent cation/H+ antiporter complex subunit F [Myxococcota bacterium]